MSAFAEFGDYDSGGGYQGYDNGGGFNKNQFGSSPDKKNAREQSVQTVTPLTATIISKGQLNPQDDTLTVDGRQVNKVVVCGRVVAIDPKTSFTEYSIDDGTDIVKVVKMNEEGSNAEENIPMNTYIKAFGAIRVLDSERKVSSHAIRVVKDQNEFTCHMLSVLHNHYLSTRGPLSTPAQAIPSYVNPASSSAGFVAGGLDEGFGGAIDGDSRKVYDVIARDETSDMGPSIQEVCRITRFPVEKVRSIISTLTSEGFIYSTIDEDHFKSTGSLT